MNLRKLIFPLCCGLLLSTAVSSCTSGKTVLPYFTNLPAGDGELAQGSFELKIIPDDELNINVSATNQEAVDQYTIPYQRPRQGDLYDTENTTVTQLYTRRGQALTYQTYRVNADGFINFPVLGKIHVAGMTLEQLADFLTEKISADVKDPIVTVELLNFHVNVMGDVVHPGSRLVTRERYSVLDALAEAGDLRTTGERKRVLLIREENGKREYHRLNLNDAALLESPYFYLQQNDVIYVEPNSVAQANSRVDADRSFRVQLTSIIVSAASVIASLAIALIAYK